MTSSKTNLPTICIFIGGSILLCLFLIFNPAPVPDILFEGFNSSSPPPTSTTFDANATEKFTRVITTATGIVSTLVLKSIDDMPILAELQKEGTLSDEQLFNLPDELGPLADDVTTAVLLGEEQEFIHQVAQAMTKLIPVIEAAQIDETTKVVLTLMVDRIVEVLPGGTKTDNQRLNN